MFRKMTSDKVLVQLVPEDESMQKTASGLFIAGTTENERYKQATVTVTGPECKVVEKGDQILFDIASGKKFDHEGTEYYFVREEAVIGVI